MSADSTSIVDGVILVATLIGWSYVLNWLTYAVPAIERLIAPPPLPVVRNGRRLWRNRRAELIIDDELMRQCRLEGVEDLGAVKAAYIESDGTLNIIKDKEGA